jgi:hypothetical protein
VKLLLAVLVAGSGVSLDAADDSKSTDLEPVPHVQPIEPVSGISNDRILGILPNFATVSDPNLQVAPLTARQKFTLVLKETVDPFTFASAAMGAGMSQAGNGTPKYGYGMAAYGQRFGAAFADMASQNFFSDGLLATLLHEDPRYYRMGPGHSVPRRVVHSMSRLVLTRKDSGGLTFNYAGVGGMAMGIALSNAYYPSASVSGSVTAGRFVSSITGAALGNLLPEFWPDVREKLGHLHHKR